MSPRAKGITVMLGLLGCAVAVAGLGPVLLMLLAGVVVAVVIAWLEHD